MAVKKNIEDVVQPTKEQAHKDESIAQKLKTKRSKNRLKKTKQQNPSKVEDTKHIRSCARLQGQNNQTSDLSFKHSYEKEPKRWIDEGAIMINMVHKSFTYRLQQRFPQTYTM